MKCAAWEEEFDTCGCLLDMRSCQGFQGAAPRSTFAVTAVNLICVLRCEGDCVYVCSHSVVPLPQCGLWFIQIQLMTDLNPTSQH